MALLSQTLTHALFDTTGGGIMYYLGVSRLLSETILLRRPYLLFFPNNMKGIFWLWPPFLKSPLVFDISSLCWPEILFPFESHNTSLSYWFRRFSASRSARHIISRLPPAGVNTILTSSHNTSTSLKQIFSIKYITWYLFCTKGVLSDPVYYLNLLLLLLLLHL